MAKYILRKAEKSDLKFLQKVHHTTLREHVEKIWLWNELDQDAYVLKDFETGQIQIILDDGAPVGYLHLNPGKDTIHIVNILILPEYQGRKMGSAIINDLMAEVRIKNLKLKLGVFKINTRAKQLYMKLGFRVCGETQTHYLMEF